MLSAARTRSQRQVQPGQGGLDQVLGGVDVTGQEMSRALQCALPCGQPVLEVGAAGGGNGAGHRASRRLALLHRRPHPRRSSLRRRRLDARRVASTRRHRQRIGQGERGELVDRRDGRDGVLDGAVDPIRTIDQVSPHAEDAEQVGRVLPGERGSGCGGGRGGTCRRGRRCRRGAGSRSGSRCPTAPGCARPARGDRRRRTCRGGSGRSARRGDRPARRRPSTPERSSWPARRARSRGPAG